MKTIKEKTELKLKKKGRSKAKGKDKLKNLILKLLIEDIENKEENIKNPHKDRNINQIYKSIPKTQYGRVHRDIKEFESKGILVGRDETKDNKPKERVYDLNPIWIEPIKANYKLNNKEVDLFLRKNQDIKFLEDDNYMENLKFIFENKLATRVEFIFNTNIRELIDNDKLSELGDEQRRLILDYMITGGNGFTIDSLEDERTRNLIIDMWKKKLLRRFEIFYN